MMIIWRVVWLLVALGMWGKIHTALAAEKIHYFQGAVCPPAPWAEHPAFRDRKGNRVPPEGFVSCFVPDPSLAIICTDYVNQLDCRDVDEPSGRVWVAPVLPDGTAIDAAPPGYGGVPNPTAAIPANAVRINKGGVIRPNTPAERRP